LWEFLTLATARLYFWQKTLLLILSTFPPISYTYLQGKFLMEFLVAGFFLSTLPYTFTRELGVVGRSVALSFFGLLYISVGFTSLILIRTSGVVDVDTAGNWLIFLFGTVWIVDTAAYYFGWQLGRRKLSPAISPNKTVVGFIGGFAGAILSSLLFNFIFLSEVGFAKLILPALIIALFGQLGDLVESIFKREAGVKDSSNIIPGHGGVLDRFDSILFASPALYLYLKWLV
jgi:phosphatidate cytidylyltransferase